MLRNRKVQPPPASSCICLLRGAWAFAVLVACAPAREPASVSEKADLAWSEEYRLWAGESPWEHRFSAIPQRWGELRDEEQQRQLIKDLGHESIIPSKTSCQALIKNVIDETQGERTRAPDERYFALHDAISGTWAAFLHAKFVEGGQRRWLVPLDFCVSAKSKDGRALASLQLRWMLRELSRVGELGFEPLFSFNADDPVYGNNAREQNLRTWKVALPKSEPGCDSKFDASQPWWPQCEGTQEIAIEGRPFIEFDPAARCAPFPDYGKCLGLGVASFTTNATSLFFSARQTSLASHCARDSEWLAWIDSFASFVEEGSPNTEKYRVHPRPGDLDEHLKACARENGVESAIDPDLDRFILCDSGFSVDTEAWLCICAAMRSAETIEFNLSGLMSQGDVESLRELRPDDLAEVDAKGYAGIAGLAAAYRRGRASQEPEYPGGYTAWELARLIDRPENLAKTRFFFAPILPQKTPADRIWLEAAWVLQRIASVE